MCAYSLSVRIVMYNLKLILIVSKWAQMVSKYLNQSVTIQKSRHAINITNEDDLLDISFKYE